MTIRDLAGEPITSLNEGDDPTTFRLHFDTVPALSGFTADQDVTITLSTPVAGQVGYTGAASVADFIDRDVASTESRQLQLTVTDDDVATADGVVTYTATVSPSGFTATAMLTLVDNEISIVTTPSTVTLATGATADYTVQLDQEPPGTVTVSVASVEDAIATVSRNTRVFTAANWNVPASITVTGMRGGSTTISHSATAAGGFGYQSTDVMVTVTPVAVNFPAGTLILDQNFRVGTAVDLTLPTATGAVTYRLSSHADQSLPAGLTFDGATRVLSGTPTAAQVAEGYVYSARNPDNLDNLNFDITVEATGTPPTAPSTQTLTLNPTMVTESATATDITATVTLNGGTYAIARSFSFGSQGGTATATTDFALLQNVTLTIPANSASGTVTFPFTAVDDMETEGAETLTIRSTLLPPGGVGRDQTLAVAEAILTINDGADPVVSLAVNAGADQTVAPGDMVTLTATVTGTATPDADLTVTWGVPSENQQALAAAVTTDGGRLIGAIGAGTSLTLTFTATAANLVTSDVVFPVRATVTDPNAPADQRTVTDIVTITIMPAAGPPDTEPEFPDGTTIATATYTVGEAITPLTLPAATGGNGALTYSLAPAIPGLTLNPTTHVLSGTPTTIAESTHTYTVTDEDSDTASLVFDIVVVMGAPPVRPTFFQLISTVLGGAEGVTALATPTTFFAQAGSETIVLTLSGPDAALFSITQGGALSFRTAPDFEMPRGMAPSGTNTNTYRVTVTATASGGGTRDAILTVTITDVVETEDTAPTLAVTFLPVQNYLTGTPVNYTLPVASGGNAPYTFTLTRSDGSAVDLPGLTFNAGTNPPTLTGTPTAVRGLRGHFYTVHDSDANTADGDRARLSFNIAVRAPAPPPPSSLTVSIDPTMVTESATPTTITATVTFVGGTYTRSRIVQVGLQDGTALEGPDFSPLTFTTLTIPANTASGTLMFPFTAKADGVAEAGGETAKVFAALRDTSNAGYDGSLALVNTNLIINDPLIVDTSPAFAAGASISDQSYLTRLAITPLTLPAVATPGNGATTYTLTPAIAGLALDPTSRVLSGTPTTASTEREYTYTATDADDDTDTLTFNITVVLNRTPDFGSATFAPTFTVNVPIPSTTLPAVVSSGNGATVYVLNSNSLPAGLNFDAATRVLSGTPTAVGVSNFIYQAHDSDADNGANDVGTLAARITIEAGIQATGFTLRVIDTVDSAVIPRLLEGQAARAYEVVATPTPAGSVFAAAQQITFAVAPAPLTPPASAADPYVPYTAVAPGTIPLAVGAASATFTFTMTPGDDELDHADYAVPITATASPSGATGTITGTIRGLTLRDNDIGIVTTVALASVAVGATTTYEVSLSEAPPSNAIIAVESQGTGTATVSPAELTFSTSSWNNAQTVTVTGVAAGTTTIRHSEDDVVGTSFITNDVMVTVTEDTAPTFGGTTVMDQTYTVDTAIESLTLPSATGGNGELTYTLTGTLATGLVFNPSTRVLAGTPTATRATTTYTYVVVDGDDNAALSDVDALTFTITVEAAAIPATGFTVSVVGDSDNAAVSEAREGTTTPVAVTATPTPAGSVFAADQMVTFMLTPASPASRPDSPDDPYVTYNNIAPRTIALAVGDARARTTFSLRPTEDAFDHADFPLTVTATAQPSGISGTATVTLIDNDITIETTLAATTVIAGATATYEVQLTEQPPTATTVTLASQGAGTATVSPATLAFSIGNWNNAQTVTVTGVAAGSTTISHTAPVASGFSYVTNDVDVTVTAAPVAPVFTNADDFDSPIMTPENRATVGADGYFAATGTGTVTYALSSTSDASQFSISDTGTLTFDTLPNFELGRGGPGFDSNDYTFTITATNSVGMTVETVTVSVTDVNEAPVVATITPSAFTEYTQGTFDIPVTDVDAGQTLTFALSAPNHGATLTGNTFTWTPGEDDGGVARTFSFTVTDSGSPPQMVTGTFDITATELANRAPTGATITAAAMLTYPDTISLEATATDPDTGDTLTYSWSAGTEGGSIIDVVGGTATYQPPTLAVGDAARMITITVTVSDSATPPLTTTATHTVTVNPPVPMTAPVFTNMMMFTSPISVAENTAAAGGPNFFAAPGTGATTLTLDGEDSAVFAITDGGTLTFNVAPDFEMPRNGAPAADNTNDYALTVTATNAFGTAMSGAITVRVTDVNEAPVLPEITSPMNFVEYSQGTFNIPFSDPDTGTTLTVSLTPPAHGATLATDGTFTWTPGEDDGGVARTFTVAIADDGSPMMSVTRDFTITATELDNRAPTGATITGGTAVTSPATITLEATAMDADTGTTLTYTWSSDATGDSFDPATGTSTSTIWTPPVLTAGDAAVMAVITVTVSDGATPALTDTDTHTVTVNPPAAVDTAPAFTNSAMFTSPIEAAENQTAAGDANFFVAPGTGTVTLTLGGTDAARFTLDDEGTLTFNDAPNFEMPRGIAFDASTNTNDYALTVTAMNSVDSVMSGAITVRVTDANDAPVLPSFTPTGFTEYSAGTLTLAATDEDLPAQMLTYALTGETRGATLTGNVFTWTPGEADGGVVRQFGVTVTDDGTPPRMVVSAFNITAVELLNRPPTGAAITADASVTNPNDLPLAAEATDPDTGDMLTYTWSSTATGDSFSPATGASVTWTPPTVTAATMVTLTVTITDTTNGSVTATQVVTVNPAATAPVFTNLASFATPIMAAENQTAVSTAGFFVAPGATAYTLTGTDMERFTISTAGTLVFNTAPNFEMPRGAAPSGTNTNTYTVGIIVVGNGLTAQSGNITIQVTDANDRPTVTSITPGSYTEHTEGTFEFVGTDEDAGQTLTYALTGTDTFGATMSSTGTFRWTPREEDGGVLRSFNVSVTDDGSPSLAFTTFFTITAAELPNRAPTGTVSVSSPAIAGDTVSVFTSASDPDSDTLTYAWSSSATGDTFGDATIASTTWVPASVSATTTVTLTVTISDGTATITPTADVVVNPAATAPVFTSSDAAFNVVEGTTIVGGATQFSATGTGAVTLTLGGTDAGLFTLAANGGLAFSTAPDFEMPRGAAFDATTNTNDYPLTVTAAASGLTTMLNITVSVTDANEAPVLGTITPPAFTEYMETSFDIPATDEDAGQTLSYSFVGPAHGATLTGNTFAWTPGEADGGETRTFNIRIVDDGTMVMFVTGSFDITVTELANRAPTGATITGAATLVAPNPITLEASAMDADTGTMLTYAWAVTTADGGSITPATGESVTYTPPTLATGDAARDIVITLTVSDDDATPMMVTATHTVTVNPPVAADTAPAFSAGAMVPAQTYTMGTAITLLTLPTATGGNGPGAITYTLTPAIPGLTFDGTARPPTITGTPTTVAAAADYTYTAADGDTNMAADDTASLMLSITVEANTAPAFSAGAMVPAQTYTMGTMITPLTLPLATGGNGAITYTLTGATLPAGLTFDGAARPPTITGTPTSAAAATMHTYTAGDTDGSAAGTDEVSLMFSITVEANTAPAFSATTPHVPSETIAQNRMITLTLPAATGGNGDITYTLAALPTGLTFDGATRIISGTPESIVAEMDYTYTAADSDGSTGAGDEDTLVVRFEVIQAPPTRIDLSVTPAAVTESDDPTMIMLTAALIDGMFTAERTITFASTDGTATAGTDYTAVSDTTLTIPANAESATATFSFTTVVDTNAESGGETVLIGRSVTTGTGAVDSEIPVTDATLTINDYVLVARAGADRTVGYGGTIRLNGGITSAAGATVVITWALSDSTAATAAFVAAGLGATEARAEVTRLNAALTAITTAAATLPAPAVSLGLTDRVALAFTLTATDSTPPAGQTVTMATDTVIITVVQDTAPAFAAGAAISARIYTVGTAITPLTLPAATGGDGAITYTLTRPAGLAFNRGTRVLTGTPTTATAATRFTYTASDQDNDTATLTFSITVNAAPGVTPAQAQDIVRNEIILPEVARALVHSTTSSITRRVGQAVGGAPPVGSFNFAGASMDGQDNLAMAVRTHGETMSEDSRDIKEMLAGSDFVLPLHAGGAGAGSSAVALWGSGEYRNFSGESDDLDWDGDLSGAQVGLDARLGDNLLVGVAVSMLDTEVDYEDDTGILGQGDYELDMTSAHPYIGWSSGGAEWWATAGHGTGELKITAQENGLPQPPVTSDINMQTIGVGSSVSFHAGVTTLRFKGEVAQSRVEVDGSQTDAGTITELEVDASRTRIAMEVVQSFALSGGGVFEPSLEIGARFDGGDGETGGGAEIGGGLRYDNPYRRFSIDGKVRALLIHGGGYEEWGISGTMRVASGADGQGLSFSLSPGYGDSGSGVQELWRHGLADENNATDETDDYAMKLDARMGYGVATGKGVLTPYSEMTHGTTDSYRMGLNWKAGERFDLTLLGEHRENTGNPAEHAVLLKGEVRF